MLWMKIKVTPKKQKKQCHSPQILKLIFFSHFVDHFDKIESEVKAGRQTYMIWHKQTVVSLEYWRAILLALIYPGGAEYRTTPVLVLR